MFLRLTWRARPLGIPAALLALIVQLAAAGITVPATAPTTSFDRILAASICHVDIGGGTEKPRQHAPLCGFCPLCQAAAHAGILLAPPAYVLIPPEALVTRAAVPPPARAPPAAHLSTAYPRGPPALI